MEIELGPFLKYEYARNNAYWARAGIDTSLDVEAHTINDYKAHLHDFEKNPTVGLLIRKKYITGKPMNYPESAKFNLRYLKKQPEIKLLRKSIKDKLKKLYPKTKHIRKYIIDNKRVVLDRTEKTRKYTILNRLKIALKRFI